MRAASVVQTATNLFCTHSVWTLRVGSALARNLAPHGSSWGKGKAGRQESDLGLASLQQGQSELADVKKPH